MDNEALLDLLYQQWAHTSGDERAWIVEQAGSPSLYRVEAVDMEGKLEQVHIGTFAYEADADFVAGMRGALGEVIRLCRHYMDEAASLDYECDKLHKRIFDLEVELDQLNG